MSKDSAVLLRELKAVFAGEALPHWQQNMDTTLMRGYWLDRIDAHLSQSGDGWIKCSERLPEEGEIVIVGGGVAHWVSEHWGPVWVSDTGSAVGKVIQWRVEHWQPLPPLPAERSE